MRWIVSSTPNGMTKNMLFSVALLVVVLIGWLFFRNKSDVVVNTPTVSPMPDSKISPQVTPLASPELSASPSPVVSKNVITYTDAGYTPNLITIKKGETVVWKNESKFMMWTASAVHPTHKAYPDTDIAFCDLNDETRIMFDACKGIVLGQSWSFKFNNIGTWGYHNHSNSSHWGKIIVE